MAFDFERFLQRNHIPYVTHGPNVAHGNLNVKCPWCGNADPSEHLGINLRTGAWGCWRNQTHRGRSPARLVMGLLRCSYQQALEIVGEEKSETLSRFDDFVADPFGESKKTTANARADKLPALPTAFKKPAARGVYSVFLDYLRSRGFEGQDAKSVADMYDIRGCLTLGHWKHRLIFPVYMDGDLITWTGRAIAPATVRYRTLSYDGPDAACGQQAAMAINDTLYGLDRIREGGRLLLVAEGVFDACKLDFYGRKYGVHATCLFGLVLTERQRDLFYDLATVYDEIRFVLDASAWHRQGEMCSALAAIGATPSAVRLKTKDPGEMSRATVEQFVKDQLRINRREYHATEDDRGRTTRV